MEQTSRSTSPGRVTDLVERKLKGAVVSCRTEFEILPVDFQHRSNPFQAFVFLCRYVGTVNGEPFQFRKCYARGCPNNLCPHVSQAVMVANRYLQRDYHRLERAGVELKKTLFSLEEMTVKFEGYQETHGPMLSIHDYIHIADEGSEVSVEVQLEPVPVVEHFAHQDHRMIFLMADFAVTCLGKTHHYERCLACFPAEREKEERNRGLGIANERLKLLYEAFDRAAVACGKRYFE